MFGGLFVVYKLAFNFKLVNVGDTLLQRDGLLKLYCSLVLLAEIFFIVK